MNPERWEEVLRLFEAARALPAEERGAFLAREGADPELVAEVHKLLSAPASGGFLEPPPLDEPAKGWDLGDFTLLEEIGRGGMGVVYRAVQRPLQRIVAVKLLPASFALSPRQIERFTREARAAARLSHPNLVTVLTVGEERGVHFFAMEFVDGDNLAEELTRLRADLGAGDDRRAHLPSSRASDYFRSVAETVRQAADGLAFAHQNGIVHRDVKPSNLLLDRGGRVKLVDFGLARDEEMGSLSSSGGVLGTPHYMSPEQARAERNKIDHRTDVYSLGVVLYELLTLRRPFEGETAQEVLHSLLQREPRRIRSLNARVPRDLETICLKAMSKVPRDRYIDAGAMRDDLQRFLSHEAIVARAPGFLRRTRIRARRHSRVIAAAMLLLSGGTIGAFWVVKAADRERAGTRLERLHALNAAADLATLDDQSLIEGRALLGQLDGTRSGPEGALLERLSGRFSALRDVWCQQASAWIEEGRRSPAGLPEGTDDARILDGVLLVMRALRVFPEDPRFAELSATEAFHTHVSVRAQDDSGVTLQGRVLVRVLDPVTGLAGEPEELGQIPIEGRALPPGFYRFEVRVPDELPRAFTRVLPRAGILRPIVCTIRKDVDPLEGMVRIEGASLRIPPESGHPLCPFTHGQPDIPSFWIDRTEVSFARYRRFLQATGTPAPPVWELLPPGASLDDRPVVGVTWYDALAYAEWCGKRLVSHAEFELAARGPEGDPLPWGRGPDGAVERQSLFSTARISNSEEEDLLLFVELASPIDGPPEARGRNGLYHMFGNVWEWTESLGFDRDENGIASSRPAERVILGCNYFAPSKGQDLRFHRLWSPSPRNSNTEHGFRCARDDVPE